MQDINCFKKQDIELGNACFLRDKSSGDQKFSDQQWTTLSYAVNGPKQQRSLWAYLVSGPYFPVLDINIEL